MLTCVHHWVPVLTLCRRALRGATYKSPGPVRGCRVDFERYVFTMFLPVRSGGAGVIIEFYNYPWVAQGLPGWRYWVFGSNRSPQGRTAYYFKGL